MSCPECRNGRSILIEILPKLLFTAFDDEFCDQIAVEITKAGGHVHTSYEVLSVEGANQVLPRIPS